MILLASLVFTAGSVIMGLSNQKEVLLLGRVVVGVGIGKFIFSVYRHRNVVRPHNRIRVMLQILSTEKYIFIYCPVQF